MKKFLVLLVSAIAFFACTPESANQPSSSEEEIFFVKYISDRPIGTASYTNEEGKTITIRNVTGSNGVFERTVGPVYKGFTCSFSMDRGTGVNDLPVRIEVKKNNQPFVIKVEGIGRVSYTIE